MKPAIFVPPGFTPPNEDVGQIAALAGRLLAREPVEQIEAPRITQRQGASAFVLRQNAPALSAACSAASHAYRP
jgi:hypothetical protein